MAQQYGGSQQQLLLSKLQTNFKRLAQISAIADVEFDAATQNCESLYASILEASTSVEYAVSRVLLGDVASFHVVCEKMSVVEEEFKANKTHSQANFAREAIWNDCQCKLEEVQAQVTLLQKDLSTLPNVELSMQQRALKMFSGTKDGTQVVPNVLSECSFGASKVRKNLAEIARLHQHVQDILSDRNSGTNTHKQNNDFAKVNANIQVVVNELDACFDLLWEARALFESRRTFQKHHTWHLQLHQRLKTIKMEYKDMKQQGLKLCQKAQMSIPNEIIKFDESDEKNKYYQQTTNNIDDDKGNSDKSPSISHQRTDMWRHVAAEIQNLKARINSVETFLENFATALTLSSAKHNDNEKEMIDELDEDKAQRNMETLAKAAEHEVMMLKRVICHSRLGFSPSQWQTSNYGRLYTANNSNRFDKIPIDASNEIVLHSGSNDFKGKAPSNTASSISTTSTTTVASLKTFAISESRLGNWSEQSDEEPLILSASQQARKKRFHRRMLGIFRERRRKQWKDEEYQEHQRVQLAKQRDFVTKVNQIANHRQNIQKNTKWSGKFVSSRNRLDEKLQIQSRPNKHKKSSNYSIRITLLPHVAPLDIEALGRLFFPSAGTGARKDEDDNIIRRVLHEPKINVEGFKTLVMERKMALIKLFDNQQHILQTHGMKSINKSGPRTSSINNVDEKEATITHLTISDLTLIRVFDVIDVRSHGSISSFDLLVGIATILFVTRPQKYGHTVFEMVTKTRASDEKNENETGLVNVELLVTLAIRSRVMLTSRKKRYADVTLADVETQVLQRFFNIGKSGKRRSFFSSRSFSSFASQLDFIDKLCIKDH